jgi:hypothetical protein
VVKEKFAHRLQPPGIPLLNVLSDAAVQLAALRIGQRLIRDLSGQSVGEGVGSGLVLSFARETKSRQLLQGRV